jgi:hypothetical protein
MPRSSTDRVGKAMTRHLKVHFNIPCHANGAIKRESVPKGFKTIQGWLLHLKGQYQALPKKSRKRYSRGTHFNTDGGAARDPPPKEALRWDHQGSLYLPAEG